MKGYIRMLIADGFALAMLGIVLLGLAFAADSAATWLQQEELRDEN